MLFSARPWAYWLGERVHPSRLTLEALTTLFAIWPLCLLAYVFAARLTYPIDLEWCEGGSLYEAYRLLHGLPIYTRGNPAWAPFPYPPLHTVAIAILGAFRLDFWTARIVSIVFFGLLCGSLFRVIYRHLNRSAFGVATGALVLAMVACGYPVIGQWYDLSRVDTMMMALVVMGLATLGNHKLTTSQIVRVALLFTAAIYTKQTAALLVAWGCGFACFRDLKSGIRLSGMTFLACLVLLGLLQWLSDGGFWFWTVAGLANHNIEDAHVTEGLRHIWEFTPLFGVVPFLALLLAIKGRLSDRSILWVGAFLASIPASLLPYAKAGGFLNNLMPMIVLGGPALVLPIADIARQATGWSVLARWGLLASLVAIVWQNPLKIDEYVPTARDRQAARELNALVASHKGGLVVNYLEFLPGRNGHTNPQWHCMAVWDSIWRGQPMNEIDAYEKTGARWALFHSRDIGEYANYVRRHSRLVEKLPDSSRIRMITGAAVVIDELWERTAKPTRAPNH